MTFTVITPYVFENEITEVRKYAPWQLDWIFEQDNSRIGPDMMYQKLWKLTDQDVFIFHADMQPFPLWENWWDYVNTYANKFPEAGILGCKLLYPAKNEEGKYYIECAGGKFENEKPEHYGSGIEMGNRLAFKTPEVDSGQYDCVREVAWYTFGGIFIRREVIDEIGDFDPQYEWSYNRDVDYCLKVREKGWKIYQIPVPLFHYQSKDVKRIRTQDNIDAEQRNLKRLQDNWKDNPLYATIDNIISEK